MREAIVQRAVWPQANDALVACGILYAFLYVLIDLLGGLSWTGYSFASQAISELTAVGAPTRRIVTAWYLVGDLLLAAFGIGVWRAAGANRGLRLSGLALLAVALLGFAWPFFPMHLRGAERTFSDTVHLVLGGLVVLLILVAILCGSKAGGGGFRNYSILTAVVMLAAGARTAMDAPRLDAGLPTPLLGIFERISVGSHLLWIAVFAIVLMSSGKSAHFSPE